MTIPRLPVIGAVLALIIFSPALTAFYTHDDFFHFSISQASTIGEFLNFFNLFHSPDGFGWYRPLTTQVFYWLGITFFNLNPLPMRLLLFANFLLVIGLVWLLAKKLSNSERIAGIATFLYAVSATHYAHLYFFSVQELGLALFYFSSLIFFLDYLSSAKLSKYLLSLAAFLLALTSKEWAVTLPFIALLTAVLYPGFKKVSGLKTIIFRLLPYFCILAVYAALRLVFYGFATGDSYVWSISPKILNTLTWYGLWSLNFPEMFVDFIGPGLHLNPNLLRYWSKETYLIGSLFALLLVQICVFAFFTWRRTTKASSRKLFLYGLWFVITLGPVLFLPWHKFSFYLTVPLFGLVMLIASLIEWSRTRAILHTGFLLTFLFLSFATVSLTVRTHWISKGQETAARVNDYVSKQISVWPSGTVLIFYDTPEDADLPWSASGVLKNVLSDTNYFRVFTQNRISAQYLPAAPAKIDPGRILVPARQFLGY